MSFLVKLDEGLSETMSDLFTASQYTLRSVRGQGRGRPDSESLMAYRALLTLVLEAHHLQQFTRCTVVASPRGVRVRLGVV